MAHLSKRTKALRTKVDRDKTYPVADAIKLVKEGASAKFNESIDVAINLGIDAKKSDQTVRGAIDSLNFALAPSLTSLIASATG